MTKMHHRHHQHHRHHHHHRHHNHRHHGSSHFSSPDHCVQHHGVSFRSSFRFGDARFERINRLTATKRRKPSNRTGLPAIGRNCFDYQSAHPCSAESIPCKTQGRRPGDRRPPRVQECLQTGMESREQRNISRDQTGMGSEV